MYPNHVATSAVHDREKEKKKSWQLLSLHSKSDIVHLDPAWGSGGLDRPHVSLGLDAVKTIVVGSEVVKLEGEFAGRRSLHHDVLWLTDDIFSLLLGARDIEAVVRAELEGFFSDFDDTEVRGVVVVCSMSFVAVAAGDASDSLSMMTITRSGLAATMVEKISRKNFMFVLTRVGGSMEDDSIGGSQVWEGGCCW
jgi:hypothetical protein